MLIMLSTQAPDSYNSSSATTTVNMKQIPLLNISSNILKTSENCAKVAPQKVKLIWKNKFTPSESLVVHLSNKAALVGLCATHDSSTSEEKFRQFANSRNKPKARRIYFWKRVLMKLFPFTSPVSPVTHQSNVVL